MELFAGTSGFSYPEWRGVFYPADLPPRKMLPYYAGELPAVEINNTFYRLPSAAVLAGWAQAVPPGFRFTFKASRRITHFKRLRGVEEETAYLLRTLGTLGERFGAILFQFPPDFSPDLPRLAAFLDLLPAGTPAAFEFRHLEWQTAEVLDSLRRRNLAWCIADIEGREIPADLPATADWGYLRLRREYTEAELRSWRQRLQGMAWRHAFVFFKHEGTLEGPAFARRFLELQPNIEV